MHTPLHAWLIMPSAHAAIAAAMARAADENTTRFDERAVRWRAISLDLVNAAAASSAKISRRRKRHAMSRRDYAARFHFGLALARRYASLHPAE